MKVYTVKISGLDHTVQLDDDDAKRWGVFGQADPAREQAKASHPANKSRSVPNK